ncbi:hypothetical protein JI58_02230 [Marinosulfonomonas sp. PRT-SC04]|nr:hypothetical protein JI58_02230 [Marinosulfonomonas sp. PRT-SC04]
MSFKIRVTQNPLDAAFQSHLSDEEWAGALEVSERQDTFVLTVLSAKADPIGYAIFGLDDGDMVAVYYARSFVKGFGPLMMKQFFGVGQILGKPLRMHVSSLRDIQVKAKMFGAEFSTDAVDGDGILQGVFS